MTYFELLVGHLVSAVVFAAMGLVVFGVALWIIVRMAPFSVRKEIEEDHNTALAIIVAAALIGISLIIAAAIQG
jgi:putative membrane protein